MKSKIEITGNEKISELTIRQFFAGLAMQGLLATETGYKEEVHIIAIDSVLYADNLIEYLNLDSEDF